MALWGFIYKPVLLLLFRVGSRSHSLVVNIPTACRFKVRKNTPFPHPFPFGILNQAKIGEKVRARTSLVMKYVCV
jgi:hypothetical protein